MDILLIDSSIGKHGYKLAQINIVYENKKTRGKGPLPKKMPVISY